MALNSDFTVSLYYVILNTESIDLTARRKWNHVISNSFASRTMTTHYHI
jgi:hypothetical protein